MAKQTNTSSKNVKKKATVKTKKNSKNSKTEKKVNVKKLKVTAVIILLVGVLLIFSSYAWFSHNLNVRIKTFNMIVSENSGLEISFDGINFGTELEISAETLIDELVRTYPNNTSQWASMGLRPVSSNGITNHNSQYFNIFFSGNGVQYPSLDLEDGYIYTEVAAETERREYNSYIAFDLFFRNDTGSPVDDNVFLAEGSEITIDERADEEMIGLLNSIRVGFVKIGTTSLDASVNEIQNVRCNNNCYSLIYEPYSRAHTNLSIERALKYNVNLVNGEYFDTYAFKRPGGPIYVENTVSGSPNLDMNYFELQETMTENEIDQPLFTVPNGITKTRIYLWIEGQDIDSLETDSSGADLEISLGFVKDTAGYDTFNQD